jgi:hypothetical protein
MANAVVAGTTIQRNSGGPNRMKRCRVVVGKTVRRPKDVGGKVSKFIESVTTLLIQPYEGLVVG